ncbi:MAG: DUF86 domain-containing protein [Thermodesulfobacteriota bacterium]
MTDRSIVLQKLAVLRDHVGRVRRRRPEAPAALSRDLDLQDAIALSLLVAIQEAVDIAFHIVSDEAWGVPASYADVFGLLANRGVIESELAARLAQAAGLRNRIAHGYAGLDATRLWSEIPDGLAALDEYAAAIARFVA